MSKKIYEKFHKKTLSQKKLIKINNFTYRHILHFINKYSINKKQAIDIGCGAGTLCFYIANTKKHILGIDISSRAIEACRRSSKNLGLNNLAKFKVVNFPKESVKGKFDLVIFSEVIEHIQDDKLALAKIFKILNKGGITIITTPSLNAPLYKLGYAKSFDERVGHLRRYTLETLIKKCEDSGFEIVETKKIEGVLRNFLFLNPYGGKLIRFIKYFISDFVTLIDNLLIPIFGESNIIIVAKKI
jgi:ubiquinone/menaquinone biosynthesis C-methylase UbiE